MLFLSGGVGASIEGNEEGLTDAGLMDHRRLTAIRTGEKKRTQGYVTPFLYNLPAAHFVASRTTKKRTKERALKGERGTHHEVAGRFCARLCRQME